MLADANAAVLMEEKDLNAESITETVRRLADHAEERHMMEQNIAAFGREDVGKRIYEEIVRLIEEKKKKDK